MSARALDDFTLMSGAALTTCAAMSVTPKIGEQLTKLALPNAESHLIKAEI